MFERISTEGLASKTAKQLERLSLARPVGDFLGSEDDLLRELEISRPTLRQAAKLAQSSKLIEIRRGTRGGYYASRPDASDAIRVLAQYLQIQGTTLSQMVVVSSMAWQQTVQLACACRDEEARAALAAFAERAGADDSPRGAIRGDTEMSRLVTAMCGNPVLSLMMEIGMSFGLTQKDTSLYQKADERALLFRLQRDLCRAILERDADMAQLIAKRRSDMIAQIFAKNEAK